MKKLLFLLVLFPFFLSAQNTDGSIEFWKNLQAHCGKAYEGKIVAGGKEGDGFTGEKLVMHVRKCEPNNIRIPFFVGDDKSRTWVLSLQEDNTMLLKHDHRNPDGSEEELTQYGGKSTNTGMADMQIFPADQHTTNILPAAATNVWWFTLNDDTLTYNLRRIGSDRFFSVEFDLTHEIDTPTAPWGSED